VDSTGVGDPILEDLQAEGGTNFTGFHFSGPSKQNLMERLATSIHTTEVGYPPDELPTRPLVAELNSFEYKLSNTGVRYCLDPRTRILTSDLRWLPAGSLNVADKLLAFDEFPEQGNKTRKWRVATVNEAGEIKRPCYQIKLEDGTEFIASREHPWLVEYQDQLNWRRTDQLQPPHPTARSTRDNASKLIRLLDVWDNPSKYETGYLAAAFDGEGSLSQLSRRDHLGYGAWLQFTQRENAMAVQVRSYLQGHNFRWAECPGGLGRSTIGFGLTGGRSEVLRFLGQVRPERLLSRFDPSKLGTLTKQASVSVAELEAVGSRTVTALGTTTGTLIAEGFASHNSAPSGRHDDCVIALGLAVWHYRNNSGDNFLVFTMNSGDEDGFDIRQWTRHR